MAKRRAGREHQPVARRSFRRKLLRRRNAFGEIETRNHGSMTPEAHDQRFGQGRR